MKIPKRQFPIGCIKTAKHNCLTDVPGIKVGHVTIIRDMKKPEAAVRTGVTAVLIGEVHEYPVAAGFFTLNGFGEFTGTRIIEETGWLDSPILLTNTHSVGNAYTGCIHWLMKQDPDFGYDFDTCVPVVAETDDSWLNDARHGIISPADAVQALDSAKSGPFVQGTVGAGTGMTTFDFAGGIGSSSRVVRAGKNYTLGVMALSNFGHMRDLIIDGRKAGIELDPLYPDSIKRGSSSGSCVVIAATDAPLLPQQLYQLAKRGGMGLAGTGSTAATTSGEFILALSLGNRAREEAGSTFTIRGAENSFMDCLYGAMIDATQEAVLNAISSGSSIKGRCGHQCPAFPAQDYSSRV
ncbi:MAG: P1 family peptidase [Candidatus Wallbacteria bacterium]|nr:P1 family peptidase [Candidatus Wallbacteria bacterium]